MLSSRAASFSRDCRLELFSPGTGGGDRDLPFFPGGVRERRDLREPRDALRDRSGIEEAGPGDSYSVSQTSVMVICAGVVKH